MAHGKASTQKESVRLRGKEDQTMYIEIRFKRRQVLGFRKGRREEGKTFNTLQVLGMNNDL